MLWSGLLFHRSHADLIDPDLPGRIAELKLNGNGFVFRSGLEFIGNLFPIAGSSIQFPRTAAAMMRKIFFHRHPRSRPGIPGFFLRFHIFAFYVIFHLIFRRRFDFNLLEHPLPGRFRQRNTERGLAERTDSTVDRTDAFHGPVLQAVFKSAVFYFGRTQAAQHKQHQTTYGIDTFHFTVLPYPATGKSVISSPESR